MKLLTRDYLFFTESVQPLKQMGKPRYLFQGLESWGRKRVFESLTKEEEERGQTLHVYSKSCCWSKQIMHASFTVSISHGYVCLLCCLNLLFAGRQEGSPWKLADGALSESVQNYVCVSDSVKVFKLCVSDSVKVFKLCVSDSVKVFKLCVSDSVKVFKLCVSDSVKVFKLCVSDCESVQTVCV